MAANVGDQRSTDWLVGQRWGAGGQGGKRKHAPVGGSDATVGGGGAHWPECRAHLVLVGRWSGLLSPHVSQHSTSFTELWCFIQ